MFPYIFGKKFQLALIIVPLIKVALGIIIFRIIKKIVKKMSFTKNNLKTTQKQKIETLKQMLINISRYIIIILVGISIMSDFGINVKASFVLMFSK